MRFIRGFGHFWYDFIVGDSAFLAVGGPVALLLAHALANVGLVELLVPAVVVATIAVSLRFR